MSDATGRPASVRPYDLVTENNPVASKMSMLESALEHINTRFTRLLRSAMLQHLRRGITVDAAKIELIRHRELLERFATPTHLILVHMKPANSLMLVAMDAQLVSTLVEARFGGNGQFTVPVNRREFTVFELNMLRHVEAIILEQFAVSWEPVSIFEPMVVRHEASPQFVSIGATDDFIIVSAFDVSIGHGRGKLVIGIPNASLEPMHKQLTSSVMEEAVNYDSGMYEDLKARVGQADITLSVELGTVELRVSDLVALRPGDVFEMARPDSVTVEASGRPLFRGKWGRHGSKIAVMVEERLDEEF